MKLIPLTRGKFAKVDDSDFEILSQFNWHAQQIKLINGNFIWYARRHVPTWQGQRNRKQNLMHRELLGLEPEKRVDHIDLDGLNNQRENFRICTESQNCVNRRKLVGASSAFKGVTWRPNKLKWEASIGGAGPKVKTPWRYLGGFTSEEDAARAYDTAARELYGEFARLNFPVN